MQPDGKMAHELPIDGVLDLHAFAPRDVSSVVEEYVSAAAAAGLREVRLIHGRGTGIQRRTVHTVLSRHPRVEDYWDAPESHLGATMAHITPEPGSVGNEEEHA